MHGLRRTVLVVSPLMVLGAAVSALATNFPVLVAGQVLIGVGCALTWVPAEAAALLDEQGRMGEVLYRTLREKGTQAAVTIRLRPAALAT